MTRKLTPKQERFVEEYLVDLNATQAAIRAGYSTRNADTIGFQLLQKTPVADAISRRRNLLSRKANITQERILIEMARLAFFDPRKLFDAEGNPMSITNLCDDAAAAINGLDVVTVGNGEVGIGQVTKYKIPDKNKALENLARILGHFDNNKNKDQEYSPPVFNVIIEEKNARKDRNTDNG